MSSSTSVTTVHARGVMRKAAGVAAASAADDTQVAMAAAAASAATQAILLLAADREPAQASVLAAVYYSGALPQRPHFAICGCRCGVTSAGGTYEKSRRPRRALTIHLHSTFKRLISCQV